MNNAAVYSSYNGLQRNDTSLILSEFLDKLNITSLDKFKCIDVGCGSGDVTTQVILPKITSGLKKLVAIDVCEEMIKFARKTYHQPLVSFQQLDITKNSDILTELTKKEQADEIRNQVMILLNGKKVFQQSRDLSQQEDRFDLAFSFYCLHWINNQRLALSNIYQLLKPDGEALFTLLANSPIFTLYEELSQKDSWKSYMKDFENFMSPYHNSDDPATEFTKNLESVGFTVLVCECRPRSYTFESANNLLKSIKAVNPFLSRIPTDQQHDYMEDCLKMIEDLKLSGTNNNNEYEVKYELLVAHVKRKTV